jgi:hypothetical protein
MQNGSDGLAATPQRTEPECRGEAGSWASAHSTMLDDFEALLEAAERITKAATTWEQNARSLAAAAGSNGAS